MWMVGVTLFLITLSQGGVMIESGFLRDNQGTPVTATVNMQIKLYNVDIGGSPLWDSSVKSVGVQEGYYTFILGEQSNPIDKTIITNTGNYYLELTISGDVITPRTRLGSSALAVLSERALVSNIATSMNANGLMGNIVVNSSGNVGIGTSVPTKKLEVAGIVSANAFIGDGSLLTGISSGVTTNWDVLSVPLNLSCGSEAPAYSFQSKDAMVIRSTQDAFIRFWMGAYRSGGIQVGYNSYNDGAFTYRADTNVWYMKNAGSSVYQWTTTINSPYADLGASLGTSALRWGSLYSNTVNAAVGYFSGNVSASTFIGDGSQLTGIITQPTTNGTNLNLTGILTANKVVAATIMIVSGNGTNISGLGYSSTSTGTNAGLFSYPANYSSVPALAGNASIRTNKTLYILSDADTATGGTYPIRFGLGYNFPSAERMVISQNGNVGIGTSAPSTKLEVEGTVSARAIQVNGDVSANRFIGDGSFLTGISSGVTTNWDVLSVPLNLSYGSDAPAYAFQNNDALVVRSTQNAFIRFWMGAYRSGGIQVGYNSYNDGAFTYRADTNVWNMKNAGSSVYQWTTTINSPYADLGASLGSSALRWGNLYTNTVNASVGYFSGNVGIGTTATPYKLTVEGTIGAREVIVTQLTWADFVFGNDYKLMPLRELDRFIQTNKHLPAMPTTEQVQKTGVSISEMNAKLLQKIEELTLYVIDLQKQVDALKKGR